MNETETLKLLKANLIEKEQLTAKDCRYYLEAGRFVMKKGDTESIQNLIQDFNYAQGQRNLCRLLLTTYFGEKKQPEYEVLGE